MEHWLLNDHLHKIHEISPDFLSVSVSGIDASNLLCGRQSILYRKSLSSVISPLDSNSHRFCGVNMVDFATLIGERERANLVVQPARFFYI